VDSAAHKATIRAGGKTVAVLGSGLRRVYPAGNRRLAEQIELSGGLMVSEYSPEMAPKGYRFAHRNRIIAALADLVVVVQAAERSGSLITAERALSIGVPVAVVPGGVDDPAYGGSVSLLRDGAHPIVDAQGIARILNRRITTAEGHSYSRLLETPMSVAELAAITEESQSAIGDELLDLELSRLVRRLPDDRYVNC
jgi:DNA processing protein